MSAIVEIYDQYQIMPTLQEHQLRVAAVAKIIAEAMEVPVDTDAIIQATLLHDMGNILKFDLSYFPDFVKPQGLAYWEGVKRATAKKYKTTSEHAVTYAIATELGVSEHVLKYIKAVGFSHSLNSVDNPRFEGKICCYADMRVAPRGVVSMQDRLAEGYRRYKDRPDFEKAIAETHRYTEALKQMEAQIFDHATIEASDITNESIAGALIALRSYNLPSNHKN